MPIIITDPYHKTQIQLTTYLTNKNGLYLKIYNDNDTLLDTINPTIQNDIATFEIHHKDYSLGTIISKAVIGITGTYNLYDLHEGISIIVDGIESSVELVENGVVIVDEFDDPIMTNIVKNPQFAINFKDNDAHTVQAIYKGNKEIGVTLSEQLIIQAQQRENDETDGHYVLTIIQLPNKLKYMQQPNWKWRLTKGGVPQSGKTIEIVHVYENYGGVTTLLTNSNGEVTFGNRPVERLRNWEVGKYKIGARFYHYDEIEDENKVLTDVWKTVEIVKNDPVISFTKAGAKGKNAKFTLKDPQGGGIANKKLTITIGGKKYIKTTSSYGNAFVQVNNKGNFQYKVTYNGDKNLNKITKTFNEVIR